MTLVAADRIIGRCLLPLLPSDRLKARLRRCLHGMDSREERCLLV